MAWGEGLVGWVAGSRRSAFIKERALEDPRVKYFPEFDEERYQSLVSVPVFGRAGEVMGVISLHAEAPHEFAQDDLDFLEHTARLLAGAIENARLYEDAAARVAELRDLSELSQRIASSGSQEQVLEAVLKGVNVMLPGDRVEIFLRRSDDRLVLRAALPARSSPEPFDPRDLWTGTADGLDVNAAPAVWGADIPAIPVLVPLVVGEERIGVLAVALRERTPAVETVLSAVASHAAVALRQHQVIEWLREENLVKDFFQALAANASPGAAELAERLRVDLDASHVVLHLVPLGGTRARPGSATRRRPWRTVAGQAEARLSARFRRSLFDHQERTLRALVPLAGETLDDVTQAIRAMTWDAGEGEHLAVGVSNPVRGIASFAQGFIEAAAAAEVGGLIRGGPGATTYDELGPYRYVLGSEAGGRDRFQQALMEVRDYDTRRGTQLLDTLEGYLDHRGNVVATSRALYIHPNTLRQRLDRIQRVSGLDLEREDWLSLAVAVKVVKLQNMRETAQAEGRE